MSLLSNEGSLSELDAMVRRGGNLAAAAELARLRRVQRWATALVDSWKHGGPDDLKRGKICAELESAVAHLVSAAETHE
jgi:hypothetical protein